jgi:hypothetical protein
VIKVEVAGTAINALIILFDLPILTGMTSKSVEQYEP